MRALLQRVTRASVEVDGVVVGEIGPGLLVFVGVGRDDLTESEATACVTPQPNGFAAGERSAPLSRPNVRRQVRGAALAAALAEKVANLRIFCDAEGKANLSLLDTGGSALVISQFTLYADYRRGRRPSFSDAAAPGPAEALVEEFRRCLESQGVSTAAGRFGAHMVVSLVNDGPYTILVDSDALASPRRGRRRAAAAAATASPGPAGSAAASDEAVTQAEPGGD